jgi:hypothetical protein
VGAALGQLFVMGIGHFVEYHICLGRPPFHPVQAVVCCVWLWFRGSARYQMWWCSVVGTPSIVFWQIGWLVSIRITGAWPVVRGCCWCGLHGGGILLVAVSFSFC